ncbi:hypothetical protein Tco_0798668 [Tanacetum coccineum]
MSNTNNNNMQTQTSSALHNAIMEAGGKDHPPMLASSNYVQWKSRIKRYIDTKPNHKLIHYCLEHPPYKFKWAERIIPVVEGSSEATTEGNVTASASNSPKEEKENGRNPYPIAAHISIYLQRLRCASSITA